MGTGGPRKYKCNDSENITKSRQGTVLVPVAEHESDMGDMGVVEAIC